MPEYFAFEADFVGTLRCIPMAARLRLDLSGVKLKLNEWSKLDRAARETAATLACATEAEIAAYRASISALVASACGAPPAPLAELPPREWDDGSNVPAQVAEQARAAGTDVGPEAWRRLSPLQRFALIKLSRSGHENKNFVPACDEFGLA